MLITQKLSEIQETFNNLHDREQLTKTLTQLLRSLQKLELRHDAVLIQIEIGEKFSRNPKSAFLSRIPQRILRSNSLLEQRDWSNLESMLNEVCDELEDIRREILTENSRDWDHLLGSLLGGVPELIQAFAELGVPGARLLSVKVGTADQRKMVNATSVQDLKNIHAEVTQMITDQTDGDQTIVDFVKRLTSSEGARLADLSNPIIEKWIDDRGILSNLRVRI